MFRMWYVIVMARRNDHTKEELKNRIIDTAWSIVAKEGLENLTARKLAKKIGYAPGTVYNIFESMDALYLQLNLKTVNLLYNVLNECAGKSNEIVTIQKIQGMAQVYFDFAEEYKPHWLMLFTLNVSSSQDVNSEEYQKAIESLFEPLESLLSSYLPNVPPSERKTAARVLWSSVHGLCFLKQSKKMAVVDSSGQPEHFVHYLIKTFIKGIE